MNSNRDVRIRLGLQVTSLTYRGKLKKIGGHYEEEKSGGMAHMLFSTLASDEPEAAGTMSLLNHKQSEQCLC